MAGPLLYIMQPDIIDPPPGTNPAALAWFGRFASGHLCHVDQMLASWGGSNGAPVTLRRIAWSEYLRLYEEAHWYEADPPAAAAASVEFNQAPSGE